MVLSVYSTLFISLYKGMAVVLDFINVPAMMAGLGPAAHSLTVQPPINVQTKESVCLPTCAAVSQDSLGRTVVR